MDTLKVSIKIDFKTRYIKIATNRINIRYKIEILKIDTPEKYIIKLIKTQRFRGGKIIIYVIIKEEAKAIDNSVDNLVYIADFDENIKARILKQFKNGKNDILIKITVIGTDINIIEISLIIYYRYIYRLIPIF